MAIDRLKKVWLVAPADGAAEIPQRLARIGLMHVADAAAEADDGESAPSSRLAPDTRDIEGRIRKLREALEVIGEFQKPAGDFLANLIPTPMETTRRELAQALQAIDIDALHARTQDLASRRAAAEAAAQAARERLAAIGAFRSLRVTVPAEGALRWTRAALWFAPARQARRALDQGLGPPEAVIQELGAVEGQALVATACLAEYGDQVAARLRELGFVPVPPPGESAALEAYVEAQEAELARQERAASEAIDQLKELSRQRRQVELVLGYWEEELHTAQAAARMVATGRAAVLTGYVRVREMGAFQAALATELPEASLVAEEPGREDEVPVSLTNRRAFRPAQFLVEMFGLPGYHRFDPSAYLMFSFVLFFGFCLGDAIYGLMLLGMTLPLVRRYRLYPGLRNFFALLAVCGGSSFVVGVLTGSWAADIWKPQYLGEGNVFARVVTALKVGDPLDKPLVALGVALGMGIANQFWAITMKLKDFWTQGDRAAALLDAGLWYVFLPGLVLLIAWFFSASKPSWLLSAGAALALVGAGGLALTQGRREEGLVAKIAVGLVSLYGIVGSYGAVTFIGDTLSYSRLLALGLTTVIVGMAVNIIGDLVGAVPVIGAVLFVVIAVPGHFFNLLISGLSAFIHSARLIFVEFFGRFYEPGARPFAPLGAASTRIRVLD
ncbi:MAG: V-type ATP synthase subunit I [Candidatus Brocadiia bacterium]